MLSVKVLKQLVHRTPSVRFIRRSVYNTQYVSSLVLNRPSIGTQYAMFTNNTQALVDEVVLEPLSIMTDEMNQDEDENEDEDELEELDELEYGFQDQKPLSMFNLSPTMLKNLKNADVEYLFPVQAQSFDVMMSSKDLQGRSKTGSGKTLAFAIPIIEKLLASPSNSKDPRACILLPTRELALQVSNAIRKVSPQLKTLDIVGGVPYDRQEQQLRRGVDIIVGTPGRIMDLIDKESLSLDSVQIAVLDEADMMLKFGFQQAVETILGYCPKDRQTVLWSATFPKWVNVISRRFLQDPVKIDLVGDEDNHVPSTVTHKAINAPVRTRIQVLENLLRYYANDRKTQTLVFTETKQEVDEISNALSRLSGNVVRPLHGDLSQSVRVATMNGFREGKITTLVCTDIAARGLDIANVEYVVQFRLPRDKESFVHRAGRTGRAGRSGTNITFFDNFDVSDALDLEKQYNFQFKHTAPPGVEQVLDAAILDVKEQLDKVQIVNMKAFDDAAEKLINERGPGILKSALALLCGLDDNRLSQTSMLTGRQRMLTVEIEGLNDARDVRELVEKFSDSSRTFRTWVHSIDGKCVVDIPAPSYDKLQQYAATINENIKVSPVTELSRVLVENTGNDRSKRNSFGGNKSFGRGGYQRNPRFSRFDSGNGGDRGSGGRKDRFDSGFQGGSRSWDRQSGKSNDRAFGRDFNRNDRSRSQGRNFQNRFEDNDSW